MSGWRWLWLWGVLALSQARAAPGHPEDPPGQLPFTEHAADTLKGRVVWAITQDTQGFLWLGTDDGLFRYDGARAEPIDPRPVLGSRQIHLLEAGRDGAVWVTVNKRTGRWQAGRWSLWEDGRTAPGVLHRLATDARGQAWAATSEGLFREDAQGRFQPVPGWPGGAALALHIDPDGEVYATAPGRVSALGPDGRWRGWGREVGLPPELLTPLARDAKGGLWLYGERRLWMLALESGRLEEHTEEVKDRWVQRALRLPSGAFWVATSRGLMQPDAAGRLRALPGKLGSPRFLFHDREGSLWVGEVGLHRHAGRGEWLIHTTREGLPGDKVWGIHRDAGGRLWVGTSAGLARATPAGWERVEAVPRTSVMAIRSDAEGGLWLGGSTAGAVLRYVPRTGQLSRHPLEQGSGNEMVYSLAWDGAGALWVATSSGVFRAEAPAWRPTRWPLRCVGESRQVREVLTDSAGRVWLSGDCGLFVIEAGQTRVFSEAEGLRESQTGWVTDRGDGRICFSYRSSLGVSCMRYEAGAPRDWLHLEASQGLASDTIYNVKADRSGRLWICSTMGVDMVDGGRIWSFDTASGLPGNNCNAWSFWADADGGVWVGTTHGLGHFQGTLSGRPPHPPTPLLTVVRVNGHAREVPEGRLELAAKENQLEAEWAVPTFLEGAPLQRQARLWGLESEWGPARGRILYSGLQPGSYTLQMRARYSWGDWSPVASVPITVHPPWWQRWWFRGAAGLGAVGLVWLVVELRQRALRRRNAVLQRLVEQRTQELREAQARVVHMAKAATEQRMAGGFAHEMRNVLTGAKMLLGGMQAEGGHSLCEENSERLKELFLRARPHLPAGERQAVAALLKSVNGNEAQLDTVLRDVDAALSRALKTTQLILDYARLGGERPGEEPVRVRPLVEAVLAESREDFEAHGIRVELAVEEEARVACKEAHLYSVVKNLVLNARDALVEQAPGAQRRLRLVFQEQPGHQVLEVEDTGTGIAPEHAAHIFEPFFSTKARGGTGLGLSLVHRLVTLYGGQIQVDSAVGRGTCFRVLLPPRPAPPREAAAG